MKKIRPRNRIFRVNTPAAFGILCALLLVLLAGIIYALAVGVIKPAVVRAEAARATEVPEAIVTPAPTEEPEEEIDVENLEGNVATTVDPITGELVTAEVTAEETPVPENLPLSGITIAVDAAKSRGGEHKGVSSGTYEYRINLTFAQALQRELESLGAKVVMTRTDNDSVVDSKARISTVNNSDAVLLISLVCNDIDSSKTRGAEAFVAKNNDSVEKSKLLAANVLTAYTEGTGMPIRMTTAGTLRIVTDKTVLTGSKVPAVGLVLGQLSNRTDDANLNDTAFVTKAVQSIAKGIREYLGK